jgi:hypothetical protein
MVEAGFQVVRAIVYSLERIFGQALDAKVGAQELAHPLPTMVFGGY